MQTRLKFLGILFLIAGAAIIVRLFYFQGIVAKELSEKGRMQQNVSRKIQANRGSILSSDGSYLTASVDAWLVFAAKPEIVETPEFIAAKLAPFFVKDINDSVQIKEENDRIKDLIAGSDSLWLPLKHKISTDTKKQIQELKIKGIGFEKQEDRIYPEASMAAQLLGFVGKDDNGADTGYFGLEGSYDYTLTGKAGFIKRESSAVGVPLPFGEGKEIEALGGVDLVTNIDKAIQIIVEQKLAQGIEKYGAKSGSIVAMDPKTGGILAMANYPSYDPKNYIEYGDEFFKNPIISDAFEPGSIFKPIVMAAGIDAGVVEPDTVCDACSGPVKVDKYFIETWDNKYQVNATMTDVIVHSNNVGMVYVGNKLGMDRLYEYITKFGIGSPTGIDLQGESAPFLRERGKWNIVDQATATFGQGIATTPIQMLRAIGIIANQGKDVHPSVVKKLTRDGWSSEITQNEGEQIISQESASKMTDMMISAVRAGEAKWASPKGYEIAGKTGTAQIAVSGHYDAEKTNASFVGFAPAHDPKFVMLVTLKEPQSSPWASETAAPLWFDIAKLMFAYMGIQPQN